MHEEREMGEKYREGKESHHLPEVKAQEPGSEAGSEEYQSGPAAWEQVPHRAPQRAEAKGQHGRKQHLEPSMMRRVATE